MAIRLWCLCTYKTVVTGGTGIILDSFPRLGCLNDSANLPREECKVKTNIRFRDESGNILTVEEVKPITPIQALVEFSLVLLIIGILIDFVQKF
jgi:hypothetical protein